MIYLDHNATAPIRPGVLEAMLPYFAERTGNPSSVHGAGRAARQGLDEARRRVAALLDVHDSQVIFTSGGTEANNMAIWGCAARHRWHGHLVTSTVEHASVLQVCDRLENLGMAVTRVGVDRHGVVRPGEVLSALRPDTILVSIMHANNETGVIQPVAEIGRGCRRAGVSLHTDAIQTVGKLPVRFEDLAVDMLSLSAHKWGGPKGVGGLVVDKSLLLDPLLLGGGQERGRRSGTENVPAIVGCGVAAELAQSAMATDGQRLLRLQQLLESRIQAAIPECLVFGQQADARLPNTTALGIVGIHGETVVMNLDLEGIAVSSGSACASGRSLPSHVPVAMSIPPDLAASMVRVSLGWNTTQENVERFVVSFVHVINRLRQLSAPAWSDGGLPTRQATTTSDL
ncbi:MAG: cysteine desulfurase [Magnetococcus sp. DMHC-8]